jgi:hypothetical protein
MQTTVKHEKGVVIYVGLGADRAIQYRSPFTFQLLRKRELKRAALKPDTPTDPGPAPAVSTE